MRRYREWIREALCHSDLSYIKSFDDPRKARKVCSDCPVAGECLQYSIMYGENGFWGGFTQDERKGMVKRNPSLQQSLIQEANRLGIYETRISAAEFLQAIRARQEREEELYNLQEF